ncbi:hypothetical protein CYMTET_50607 [Cymbomonas tetramitiformis]|uniref:Uncharacterized protein n=1 Tax=Cymbomonas tetramitiformis TaxID=36881 RepID=A0AAE0ESM9_9CHLO|nr:hypothetical protein CYMTET_50607 [Cymbomonas tetramitiformis]
MKIIEKLSIPRGTTDTEPCFAYGEELAKLLRSHGFKSNVGLSLDGPDSETDFAVLLANMPHVFGPISRDEVFKLLDLDFEYDVYHYTINELIFTVLPTVLRGMALSLYEESAYIFSHDGRCALQRLRSHVEGIGDPDTHRFWVRFRSTVFDETIEPAPHWLSCAPSRTSIAGSTLTTPTAALWRTSTPSSDRPRPSPLTSPHCIWWCCASSAPTTTSPSPPSRCGLVRFSEMSPPLPDSPRLLRRRLVVLPAPVVVYEWDIVKESLYILDLTTKAVDLLQTTSSPTSGFVLPVVGGLIHKLKAESKVKYNKVVRKIENISVQEARQNLLEAIEQRYFKDLLACKLEDFAVSTFLDRRALEHIEQKSNLVSFLEDSDDDEDNLVSSASAAPSTEVEDEFKNKYLSLPACDGNLDILEWWRGNSTELPNMARMASEAVPCGTC